MTTTATKAAPTADVPLFETVTVGNIPDPTTIEAVITALTNLPAGKALKFTNTTLAAKGLDRTRLAGALRDAGYKTRARAAGDDTFTLRLA